MQIYHKIKPINNLVSRIIVSWINQLILKAAIKATKEMSKENNGTRFYLCDLWGELYIINSKEVGDINRKMSKSNKMPFDELIRACIYYKDRNGEFMKPVKKYGVPKMRNPPPLPPNKNIHQPVIDNTTYPPK